MRKVDDLLRRFLDRIDQSNGAPYVGLFRGWRQIVGDRIADHVEPVDIRGTALIVEADHPGWVQMVMMSRRRIISELNRRYPELHISGMHVRVAGEKANSRESRQQNVRSAGTMTTSDQVSPSRKPAEDESEALKRIEDSDLRGSLERLRDALDDDE